MAVPHAALALVGGAVDYVNLRVAHAYSRRVRMLKDRSHLSSGLYARKVGISPAALSQILKGKRSVSICSLLKIIQAEKVSADWLLGLSEEERAPNPAAAELLVFTTNPGIR